VKREPEARERGTTGVAFPGEGSARRGLWSAGWSRFRRNRFAVAGMTIVVVLYAVAILAPLFTPYDPVVQGDVPRMRYAPPSPRHLLGTDKFGRDVLTRILYGSRISLLISILAVSMSVVLGSIVGAVAGYLGGAADGVIMRIVDALMAIPRIFLIITCIALFSGSLWLIIVLLGATGWMATARLVRGQVLSLRGRDFVLAAEAGGAGGRGIVLRHLLPNTLTVIIVAATLRIGGIILTEAALSFLGLGVQQPTPSWGQMVFAGREVLMSAWWVSAFPGLAIAVTVIGFNLLGDGLRDAFDPKQFA
jgi:peptide/nickel transport system permease protein